MLQRLGSFVRQYHDPTLWFKLLRWRIAAKTSHLDAIFVVGCPRSGTTLLQRMLSVHSNLLSFEGETGLFTWQNIFLPGLAHFGLPPNEVKQLFDQSSDVVDFFEKGVHLLKKKSERQRVVEKTPQHVLHLDFITRHFPNSTIIHIVRDGRDCYCSAKSHQNIPQRRSASAFAKYWKRCVSAPEKCKSSTRVLTIRYEEMVSRPGIVLQGIMDYIGLDLEKPQLDSVAIGNDHRAKDPNFRRLGQPINGSSIGRWRQELSCREVQKFEATAGELLTRYGYDLMARPA